LKKESITCPIFAEEGATGFVKQVADDHSLEPGLHRLTVDGFTCTCGYAFAERRLDKVDPES
jgi:hypothetical protein